MINRVVLIGRTTKDPVLSKTGSGTSVTNFTIACDRRVKTEGQPTADFIGVVVFGKTADAVHRYTRKGSLVGIEGRIQTRSYDDTSGKRVYVTEVVADSVQFMDGKNQQSAEPQAQTYNNEPNLQQNTNGDYQSDNLSIQPDDLPF